MIGGKESQGSADHPEFWKELPPLAQMRPSVLLPLVTCEPWPESAHDLAKAAGQRGYMWFLSHAEPSIMVLCDNRGKPGAVQRDRDAVDRGMAFESRELVCGSSFLLCGLRQAMPPR